MPDNLNYIAQLEWLNYAATQIVAQKTPGLNLSLSKKVIISSSEVFPVPDTTHACLLRFADDEADQSLNEVIAYFEDKGLPPAIYLSPACTPLNLDRRLQARGFKAQPQQEAWLTFDLANFDVPDFSADCQIETLKPEGSLDFARVFMAAFEMPLEYAPVMAQLVEPSIGLPGVFHYLALVKGEPVATFSLICHQKYGVIGSAAVVPSYRRKKAITALIYQAGRDAKANGVELIITQTEAEGPVERLLRLGGFKKIFTRTGYILQ